MERLPKVFGLHLLFCGLLSVLGFFTGKILYRSTHGLDFTIDAIAVVLLAIPTAYMAMRHFQRPGV